MAQSGSDEPIIPEGAGKQTSAPPSRAGEVMAARLPAGMVVSRYRIESVLGEGAMGMVYLARQEKPDRQVALKLVRPGLANARLLRRFEQEAEVLGRLLHPGIAQIYEAGTADAGFGLQPFFAMELVRGVSLTEYASEKELSTRQRLELMSKVCDAVEHAHQKGVIHRDLKPGNILVTEEGQPKILDFGVARATDSDLQQTTLQTDVGQLIGTIPYMSPEQVGGDPSELDTRSDVYALGVILFELLAGRLPYSLERRMIHEAARVIREEEPSRLSSINKTLRGDVETIVSHALEKEKSRRYQTASALGADIRRYLADEPITARPASTWYQLRKFSRRNRALVGGVAATFLVLGGGLAVSVYAFAQVRSERDAKDKALTLAREEAERARAAREAERERADELDKVIGFQATQFVGLDTQLMGIRMREEMISEALSALEKSGMPAEEIAQTRTQLQETLARGNPTNVALRSLYDNIFAPALKAVDEQFADQPLVRARLLQTIATTLRELGLLKEAEEAQVEALQIRRSELGTDHPDTLLALSGLGVLRQAQGRFGEAEALLREALQKSRDGLGEEHEDTLLCMNNLAFLLHAQGKLDEAELYYREALEKRRLLLGDQNADTLTSVNNMGGLLEAQGKLQEAELYYREALEQRRRLLGEDHASTLASMNNVGGVLEAQGNLAAAEPYFSEALQRSRRNLGEQHPQTLASINNMGFLLKTQGKFQDAMPYYAEALEKRRRLLGEDHPNTIISINNMGALLREQGRLQEAEPYYREALEKFRRVLGDEHPNTLVSINNMASLLEALGDTQAAEVHFREALEKFRRVLGEDHPNTLVSMHQMGGILEAQGKLQEAEPYYREALLKSRKILGEEHPSTLAFINSMGGLLEAQGRFAEAEQHYAEALEKCRRVLGESHPHTIITLNNMGNVLRAQDRLAEAEPYLDEALQKSRLVLGEKHPSTLRFLQNMGLMLQSMGRNEEATELLVPAEAAMRASFEGGNQLHLARFLTILGCARAGMAYDPDRFALAEANLLEAHSIFLQANGPTHADTLGCTTHVVALYDTWHAAEPDKGYDAKAAEWRAKLEELQAATRPAVTQPATQPSTEPAATKSSG